MISSPPYYHRQYQQDILTRKSGITEGVVPVTPQSNRMLRITIAVLPILSFYLPHTPFSIALGGVRSVTHLKAAVGNITKGRNLEGAIKITQLLLSLTALACLVTAVATTHLNPAIASLLVGVDDLIGNMVEIIKAIKTGDKESILENSRHLVTSLLYMAFLTYGYIEILAICMLLQGASGLHQSIDAAKRKEYLEGICHLASSVFLWAKTMPQARVIDWKRRMEPTLEGQLRQDKKGFVYVDVDDNIIFELNKVFKDQRTPPYFNKGQAGAHITVITIGELPSGTILSELGRTIKFNIAYQESLKPQNLKGVSRVSFLGVSAPGLDAFRAKYGLSPKISGSHDFHITYGVEWGQRPTG